MSDHHLAQINIGRLLAPIDHPQIAGFVAQLDAINQLAERSAGFVWRLKSASGNATNIPYNDDPLMIANMSVWQSVEALKAFTYQSAHVEAFRQRKYWFETMTTPYACLWWIPAGQIPSVLEGQDRLQHFTMHGASPRAFWFSETFPPESLSS